jgi:hypothetical protein
MKRNVTVDSVGYHVNVICRGLVYVQWVRGYCSFGGIVDHHYLNKNVDITTCFLNNLHQVRSKR